MGKTRRNGRKGIHKLEKIREPRRQGRGEKGGWSGITVPVAERPSKFCFILCQQKRRAKGKYRKRERKRGEREKGSGDWARKTVKSPGKT